MSETTTGALAKALAAAQKAVRAVPHDARNDFMKFNYTSAEAILEATKDALADNGLALLPVSATLAVRDNGVMVLCSRSLLLHASGESQPIDREFPVVPDKGRPLDKAVASAMTTSLAYALRDLLAVPRCDPADDLAGREDRPQQRQERPRQQPAPTPQGERGAPHQPPTGAPHKPPPATGAELLQRLLAKEVTLVTEGLCEAGELVRHVLNAGTKAGWSNSMANWGEEAIKLAAPAVKAFEEDRRALAARQARALAELRQRCDDVTPQGLADLERDVMAAELRPADRDELVRGIREKAEAAKGKGKRAKAG